MTDHNARQAGKWHLIDPHGKIVATEASCVKAWARIEGYKPTIEGLLGYEQKGWRVECAAHSADARNGQGVALTDEISERVSKMRNALYAIANSDPDGYVYELRVMAAKAWEESLTLAAPAAPAPHANCPAPVDATEAAEREHLGCAHCNTGIYAAPAPKLPLARPGRWRDGDECEPALAAAAQADDAVLWSLNHELGAALSEARRPKITRQQTTALMALVNAALGQQSATPAASAQARIGRVEVKDGRVQSYGFEQTDIPSGNYELFVGVTPTECTCPSGNGSLRHPCPVHAVEAVKVMCGCGDQYPMDSYEAGFIEGRGHCENCDAMSATPAEPFAWTTDDEREPITNALRSARMDLYGKSYTVPLYRATPADAASEADKNADDILERFKNPLTPYGMLVRALRIVANKTLMDMANYVGKRPSQLSAMEHGRTPVTYQDAVDASAFFNGCGIPVTLHALEYARIQRERQQGAQSNG